MTTELKPRVRKIIRLLKRAYPDAKCSLNHSNAFELLIATILSAQCTDQRSYEQRNRTPGLDFHKQLFGFDIIAQQKVLVAQIEFAIGNHGMGPTVLVRAAGLIEASVLFVTGR